MATEIRLRAERRLGEMIREQKETVGLNKGGGDQKSDHRVPEKPGDKPTLASQGIDKNLADRARKAAALSDDEFKARVEQAQKQAHWGINRDRAHANILAVSVGANSAMIRDAVKLYIADGAVVADVTFGRGAFWTETDLVRFTLLKSDLNPANGEITRADLRHLPYADASVDVEVLDPPYAYHIQTTHLFSRRFSRGTPNMTLDEIRDLFREGMVEARRVLKPGGLLWVKCKDSTESGAQRWQHVEVYNDALALGFAAKDLFLVISPPPIASFWKRQRSARKAHSYLWIFQKPGAVR
jgi:hypothetical protein